MKSQYYYYTQIIGLLNLFSTQSNPHRMIKININISMISFQKETNHFVCKNSVSSTSLSQIHELSELKLTFTPMNNQI